MSALPLAALACVAIALAVGAFWTAPKLPRAARWRVVLASALAIPMAWLAVLALADQALALSAPSSALTYASYVGGGIVLLAALVLFGAMMPERRVWLAAAIVPLATVLLATIKPGTRTGGIVTVLLSLVMLAAAGVLPRAWGLASQDRSRAFVAMVAGATLVLGGGFGAWFGAAAVSEGGLGLATAARDWTLVVEPSGSEAYTLIVPFVSGAGPAAAVVAEWQAHARVTEGDGEVGFVESRDAIEIIARGPVTVEARYLFHAPTAMRLNLTAYAIAEVPAQLQPLDGVADDFTARIAWRATASLDGAECAAREVVVDVSSGTPAPLPAAAGDPRAVWPDGSCLAAP